MAIDGVAPRAKMNQQRSRRFRSAKDAKEARDENDKLLDDLRESGMLDEDNPEEKKSYWDSNQITPGTPFMAKVAESLRYYVADRITNDPGWANVIVIISDASVPGEGEHKLMEYIRYQHSKEGYDANTKHCICGLDADLIMLALASHEPHFSLLREDVLINERQEYTTEDGREKHQPYQFLHINVLREYLEKELQTDVPFDYDFERIVDDFVMLCFFVGNDFLPHMPTLSIREGAVSRLMNIYRTQLPQLQGYITENGKINFSRLELILKEIGKAEDEILKRRVASQRQYANRGRNGGRGGRGGRYNRGRGSGYNTPTDTPGVPSGYHTPYGSGYSTPHGGGHNNTPYGSGYNTPTESPVGTPRNLSPVRTPKTGGSIDENNEHVAQKLRDLLGCAFEIDEPKPQKVETKSEQENEPEDLVKLGEEGWRERYYQVKFGVGLDDKQFFERIRQHYLEGLEWVLQYYYQGCASWKWFYPYYYAPFALEIGQEAANVEVDFSEETHPFRPFEQLLSVLPKASSQFLPDVYADLMLNPESPISDFYPENFEIDMEGSKRSWQGVVKLPFIDEERLFDAIKELDQYLSDEEIARNSAGYDTIYVNIKHPIANHIIEAEKNNTQCELDQNTCKIFGSVSPMTRSNTTWKSPISIRPDIKHAVVCARFHLPQLQLTEDDGEKFTFESILRPGLIMPLPVLAANEYTKPRGFHPNDASHRTIQNSLAIKRSPHHLRHNHPYDRPPQQQRYDNNPYSRGNFVQHNKGMQYQQPRGGYNDRYNDRNSNRGRGPY